MVKVICRNLHSFFYIPMGISLRGRSFPENIEGGKFNLGRLFSGTIELEGNSRGISRGGELGRRFPSKLLFLLRSRFKMMNSPFLPRESPRTVGRILQRVVNSEIPTRANLSRFLSKMDVKSNFSRDGWNT